MRVQAFIIRVTLVIAAGLAAVALQTGAAATSERAPANTGEDVRLAVPGRSNAFVSLASSGDSIVAVWGATSTRDVTDVYSAVSRDGGVSFSSPSRVNDVDGDANLNGEQAPRVAVAPPSNGSIGVITVVWPSKKTGVSAIRMARSMDGGRTFSKAVTLNDPSAKGARAWQSLAAAPDGAVHVVWLDGRHAVHAMQNAGATHAGAMEMHKGAPRQDVFYATWKGNGPIREQQLATDVCFCCKTAVAVDRQGVVYAAWRDLFPDSIRDITFAKSKDEGTGFGEPVRVSVDNWKLNGCPEDGPAITVDQTAAVHIVWPTLVDGPEPHKGIFYATSRDGRAFTPRVRLDAGDVLTPSHPQMSQWGTTGLIVAWDEIRSGMRQVVVRYATTTGRPQAFQPAMTLTGQTPGGYPAVAAASRGAVVAWTSGRPENSSIAVRRFTNSAGREEIP